MKNKQTIAFFFRLLLVFILKLKLIRYYITSINYFAVIPVFVIVYKKEGKGKKGNKKLWLLKTYHLRNILIFSLPQLIINQL